MSETLIEGRRSDGFRLSSTRVPPGLEWRVLDEGRRERTVRFGVAFDVPQAMRDAVAALPDEVTARRAAEELANTDGSGVAVLFDGAQTIALVPAWSGQALYWAVKDGVLLLSTSARSIAKEIGTAVSRNFLASFLVDGLPLGVASRIAPWDGVQALAPFEALRVDRNLTGRNFKARPIQIPPVFERPGESEEDVDNAVAALRQALFEATFRWCERGGPISCDVSGGVDSAANAYLLRALHVHFDATHASSSSQYNLDDMWARRIVNDVGAPAAFYPAIGSTGLTYDASVPFPNGYIPETPPMWCDSEGYAQALADRPRPAGVQFTGLGGDELFAPLPAMEWSLAHQAPLRAPFLAVRYCLNRRLPLRRGIPSIASKIEYGRWIDRSMRELASKGSTSKDDLSWSGEFAYPSYLSGEAKELLHAPFDAGSLQPMNRDRTVHQVLESLLGQAAIIRQINDMLGRGRTTWASIFVDPGVVRAALALPLKMRRHPFLNKPMLYRAMRGLMPREIFARATKGEYSQDSYETLYARRKHLVGDLADGAVADLGLIDRKALKTKLSMQALSSEFLFELKRLVAAERWIRSVR